MRKWMLAALLALPPAVAGGLLYARSATGVEKPGQVSETGYTCPLTGEELPCPDCCPLSKAKTVAKAAAEPCCPDGDCCPECCADSDQAPAKTLARASAK
jgi:hypothetical protein